MSNNDIDKAYISFYDQFLCKFDDTHKKTPSQLKEIAKHQRIASLRDDAKPQDVQGEIWGDF